MTDPCALSTRELAAAIRGRELSAREALDAHLARIAAVNPVLNAVVTLDEEGAHERAAHADAVAATGPLHGVPMTHKDTHDVAGMRTTFGSPLLRDNIAPGDDLIIARLRAAGVNSTGKTNVPEFAAGSHTFNPLFGTTVNPYDPTRSAGGSSGGVAVAIATGIQAAGDGSDMGGSVRTPAAFCNIVGFRPSSGRIPVVPAGDPYAWLARPGVLGRRVDDVAYLLEVVAGPDPRAPVSLSEPSSVFGGPLREDLAGLRIGWTPDFGLGVPVEPEILAVLEPIVARLEELGAVVEPACPDLRDADEVFATTRAFDFAFTHTETLREHRAQLKPALVWNIEQGLALTGADLLSAARARARLELATRSWFTRFDLLVTPATQVLPFDATLEYPAEVAGTPTRTYLDWMRASTLISATGLPAASVPAGFAGHLPVGLQLVAGPHADVALLHAAHAVERLTPTRPSFTA